MKDMGPLTYFLGLEISRNTQGYLLSQWKYTCDLIKLANLTDNKTHETPLELNVKYEKDDGDLLSDVTSYRQPVGRLVYLTMSRPDISYAVHVVSQFVEAPCTLHMTAVHRIIRYLRGTLNQALLFSSSPDLQLSAYSDANWARCPISRRSTTGYCVFLGQLLVSWKCKKQTTVSRSSTKAEYRVMVDACSEITWFWGLLIELGILLSVATPLYADNLSAIQLASNPIFQERTKHIEVDCHFVREKYTVGIISLPHVTSELQLADFFTKTMTSSCHRFLHGKLMLVHYPTSV
ncbi:uncharacterized mitochondrial protein AtMg00810-like [Magnolia sinica]|uniref:uncharacterized mitochondrial protein AtMg00810-like n=1 Tax=Magnolia sinica TaxID=86752 RepID=UPI00265A6CF1|nr:uncharacterized mitochondrial protein AtMg00810-like [Magnolia sinica]